MVAQGTTLSEMPEPAKKKEVAVQSSIPDLRPAEKDRLFRSDAVERQIEALRSKLTAINPKLFWMFQNCFPNTLDTTVHYSNAEGDDDTFVYTGDIHAMWLRDSAAQVWPYLRYVKEDEPLRHLIRGVIRPAGEVHPHRPLRQRLQHGTYRRRVAEG